MSAFKILLFVAIAAVVVSASEFQKPIENVPEQTQQTEDASKDKRGLLLGYGAYPYYYPTHEVYNYGYDSGKYYPGKYERPYVSSPLVYSSHAYPYSHYYTSGYSAHPYGYYGYPYAKHVVY